jgi:hypothetical protein
MGGHVRSMGDGRGRSVARGNPGWFVSDGDVERLGSLVALRRCGLQGKRLSVSSELVRVMAKAGQPPPLGDTVYCQKSKDVRLFKSRRGNLVLNIYAVINLVALVGRGGVFFLPLTSSFCTCNGCTAVHVFTSQQLPASWVHPASKPCIFQNANTRSSYQCLSSPPPDLSSRDSHPLLARGGRISHRARKGEPLLIRQ